MNEHADYLDLLADAVARNGERLLTVGDELLLRRASKVLRTVIPRDVAERAAQAIEFCATAPDVPPEGKDRAVIDAHLMRCLK